MRVEPGVEGVKIQQFYGRHIWKPQNPLDSRHAIQDFTYSANYLEDYVVRPRESGGNGGSGLERHDFHHFDCPLNAESGAFILAKFLDQDEETVLHISAFRIPTRHTLYIPSGVIHSNDYLKGTWRTMLSDGPIDHAHLFRGPTGGDVASQFHFTFQ